MWEKEISLLPQKVRLIKLTDRKQYHCWMDKPNMEKSVTREDMMTQKVEESVSEKME